MQAFVLCGPCASLRFTLLRHLLKADSVLCWSNSFGCNYEDALIDVMEAWELAGGLVPHELDAFSP